MQSQLGQRTKNKLDLRSVRWIWKRHPLFLVEVWNVVLWISSGDDTYFWLVDTCAWVTNGFTARRRESVSGTSILKRSLFTANELYDVWDADQSWSILQQYLLLSGSLYTGLKALQSHCFMIIYRPVLKCLRSFLLNKNTEALQM